MPPIFLALPVFALVAQIYLYHALSQIKKGADEAFREIPDGPYYAPCKMIREGIGIVAGLAGVSLIVTILAFGFVVYSALFNNLR